MYLGSPTEKNEVGRSALSGPAITLTGSAIPPLVMGLPKKTASLCPECLATIPAIEYEKDGKVFMSKECKNHGVFNDIISSDVRIFNELEKWHFRDGSGFANPQVTGASRCPSECGICNMHATHTSVANIDLTSRCNLSCNICFADSNKNTYEPSLEEIGEMLQRLRDTKPAPCTTIQYTGGEPTIHPQFLDIVRKSRDLGFTHIQCATNGLKLADPDFAKKARDAGLQYLYLQMDGVTDDVFEKIRGRRLLETKLKTIEAARTAGLRIIFVPTIIRGVNDHQIGDLIRLAFDNLDVLTGISIQPIVFTGRYPEDHRMKERYTLADMVLDASRQTGFTDPYRDWFSLNSGTPFVKLAEALTGNSITNHACHPHCGAMSLLFVDKDKNAVPVTRFLDFYNALKDIESLAAATKKSRFNLFSKLKTLNILRRHFSAGKAPKGLTFAKFLKTLDGYADKKYTWTEEHRGHAYKTFFIFGMHFMDNYNYDLQRIRRCAVHYTAADGRLYPFCTYNSGHIFRDRVEKQYAENRKS
ncbi:MAG TPA: radical SAM protein [Dissulfurispiraceae bacterium]|nr:radical SAM protein [Dissulfurispiraceae bacterium]